MTKEDIKAMFRLAAKVRHMPPCERGRDMQEMALEGAMEQYRDEVLPKTDPGAPTGEVVPWQQALEYVGALERCEPMREIRKDGNGNDVWVELGDEYYMIDRPTSFLCCLMSRAAFERLREQGEMK